MQLPFLITKKNEVESATARTSHAHTSIFSMNITSVEWQLIANPNALTAQRRILETSILQQLEERGVNYQIHFADGAGHGIQTAEKLCRAGHRNLIVVGGDGSINEVVNGIYRSGVNPEEVYLAIIPLGTGNDFCRTLGYPTAESAVDFLMDNDFQPTDVGLVTSMKGEESIAQRYFINIAGFAFDAAVINETVNGKPKFFPSAVYLMKLVKVLFKYKATPVTIATDSEEYQQDIFTIAVGNAQYNGNGMRQVPMAHPGDGEFDIVSIRKLPAMKVVANVKRLFAGEHIKMEEVHIMRTKSLRISSTKPLLGEVEGEMLTTGNYHISMAQGRLNVLGNFVEKK